MTLLLNLGAGERVVPPPAEGWRVLNHDRTKHSPAIETVHDLSELPWPWKDGMFAQVVAWAVLEHLHPTLLDSINECWRILRVGGRLDVKLPYWNHEESHIDPTHRWFAALGTFDHFDPSTDRGRRFAFYGTKPWRIIERGYTAEGASVYARLDKLEER